MERYSFDSYKNKGFNFWTVTLPIDKLKWLDSMCKCPGFFEKFMSKHVIGMTIRLNYCKPPPAVTQVSIGKERRRVDR
ncbi:unnamed protein product [Rotaria sp. Silwood2]|nr:unnamed protein product [Rotaria sp. Silwood2]CAF3154042.1 unnamed protein product [Rotaria sp. Silwood2]CAF3531439.1 unnamed protein product [Rotaria sp. Silwood2]CAF4224490.1 unnamed protein product [Rotaria sp. Silwood2]CAF4493398.1 unnamed protein product [Rotaria sp. Silwood2]